MKRRSPDEGSEIRGMQEIQNSGLRCAPSGLRLLTATAEEARAVAKALAGSAPDGRTPHLLMKPHKKYASVGSYCEEALLRQARIDSHATAGHVP